MKLTEVKQKPDLSLQITNDEAVKIHAALMTLKPPMSSALSAVYYALNNYFNQPF